jgi:hypothetical protein
MEAIIIEALIFRVILLLCFLILPFSGRVKKRKINHIRVNQTELRSDYGVNERGELELMKKENTKL